MSKTRTLPVTIILLTLISAQALLAASIIPASATTAPGTLKIFAGPTSVPADNQAYNIIAVQLQTSTGAPQRASQDTEVRLSSSSTNVGNVDQTVTIPQGSTSVLANFYSTYTPGTTTITATATGYPSTQVTITTVAPTPVKLAVYAFPPILPADGNSYQALFVQLQDSSGNPSRAPVGGITATLTSTNASIASVDPSVSIPAGKSSALANVMSILPGTITVTATASGYGAGQATVTVQQVSNAAANIKLYLAPPKIQADGNSYQQIAIELQDAKGNIAETTVDTAVSMTSSNTPVATVNPTVTISAGHPFALTPFTTTYQAGITTITAAATDYTTSQATLTTTGSTPSKLAIFTLPTSLPADAQSYDAIRVQLQDSTGKPVPDLTGDDTIYLSTSTPASGNVTTSITIPSGQTQAPATFTTTCAPGTSTITAQASGYTSGQAKITTSLIDLVFLNVSLTANPPAVAPGNQTTITAYVSYNGTGPALGMMVNLTSNKVGTLGATQEQGNGFYTTVFTAPKAANPITCTITANATSKGYNGTSAQIKVSVDLNYALQKGALVLQVVGSDGTPVSDAIVTSENEPAGVQSLNSVTNVTGYVSFNDIPTGNYTLQVAKDGYKTIAQTIQLTGNQTVTNNVSLSKNSSNTVSVPLAAGIAVVAVVAVVAVFLFFKKRHTAIIDEDAEDDKRDKETKKRSLSPSTSL